MCFLKLPNILGLFALHHSVRFVHIYAWWNINSVEAPLVPAGKRDRVHVLVLNLSFLFERKRDNNSIPICWCWHSN